MNPRGQPADSAPDDSLAFVPDRQLAVGGVEVTVRELTFSEQLRHNHLLARPMPGRQFPWSSSTDRNRSTSSSTPWLGTPTMRELLAISCGQSVDWVDALPADDGEALVPGPGGR